MAQQPDNIMIVKVSRNQYAPTITLTCERLKERVKLPIDSPMSAKDIAIDYLNPIGIKVSFQYCVNPNYDLLMIEAVNNIFPSIKNKL